MPFNGMSLLRLKKASNYSTLTSLDLSWNYLSDPSIATLEQLTSLEKINLAGNRLTLFPAKENSFPNLKELRLQSNQLTENCFLNFVHLNQLIELHLNQNLIKAVPLMISEERKIVLFNLQLLDLTGNPIAEDTKLLPVASCPKLRTIIICQTGLARKHNGYPPLIKKYLINRLGIRVIKDLTTAKSKKKREFRHSRKVDTYIVSFLVKRNLSNNPFLSADKAIEKCTIFFCLPSRLRRAAFGYSFGDFFISQYNQTRIVTGDTFLAIRLNSATF